ncbi:MAG: FHA domain-containing protein [Planctomycetaceae bacterium]|jgi:pSer/pThr/pTyr-binding forkhead associated (FHA) protein|nr:FHA domain-containing protein [Planctomycetaceae bacterium]
MKINVSIFAGGVLKGSKQVTTPCIVGRSKEADLPIAHPAMSRKHCELFEKAGNLYLRDNSSLNGTIYKGGYIESPTQLTTEDEFSVGELTFKITLLTSSSSEEQQETTDVATVATSTDSANNAVNNLVNNKDTLETNESSSNVVTILESPQNPQTPANEDPPPKKSSKKISPKDVRIKI